MKPKTLLYILIAIAIVAVVAFIVYQFISGGSGETPPREPGKRAHCRVCRINSFQQQISHRRQMLMPMPRLAQAASSSKFGVISNDPALDYFVNAANTVTLIKPDGTIESIVNRKSTILSGHHNPKYYWCRIFL